jgi:hypothetical protein
MTRIGPRMAAIREYVTANPGASVSEVLYSTHLGSSYRWWSHATHRKAVYRAEAARLIVIDRQQSNRYRLYDAEYYKLEAGRGVPLDGSEAPRDGYWRPAGHP